MFNIASGMIITPFGPIVWGSVDVRGPVEDSLHVLMRESVHKRGFKRCAAIEDTWHLAATAEGELTGCGI